MNIISIILLTVTLFCLFIAGFTWRNRKVNGAYTYMTMMLASSIYSTGYAFELSSSTLEQVKFWLHIEYLGIVIVPLMWLIFIFQYIGQSHRVSKLNIILLSVVPVITLVSSYTNDWHHLFYTSMRMDYSGTFPIVVLGKGLFYWIHIAYFHLIVILVNVFLIRYMLRNREEYRRQAVILLLASTIPWIANLIYLTGNSPENIDLNPFTISIAGLVIFFGQFRYRIFDFVPIALEHVFNSMDDAIILADNKRHIISYNRAALNIIPDIQKTIGTEASQLFKNKNLFKLTERDGGFYSANSKQEFQMTVSENANQKQQKLGYIYNLSNITEQRERERQLHELNKTKDKFFTIIANNLQEPFNRISELSNNILSENKHLSYEQKLKNIQSISELSFNYYNILETLLNWTRLQTDRIEHTLTHFNLTNEIKELIKYFKPALTAKNINIISLLPSDYTIEADQFMIKTIVGNLLSNAIKYSHINGQITILVEKERRNTFIFIKDEGIGFKEEDIEHINHSEQIESEPGTANELGTGLGLYICKEFIAKHKGKLSIESKRGKGANVSVYLPVKSVELHSTRTRSKTSKEKF